MTESASPPGPAVFAPLHRWLGREAERLSMELLDAAVAAGLEEHADLDFKLNPPVSGALMQSDLPKDIAAMANSGGGMLLLGVSDSGSRASDAPGVAPEFILDTCLRDLRRVAINRVSPPVSDTCNTPEPSGEPPFNSNRSYNVIFNRHDVTRDADAAQIQAFDDTWRWTPVTEQQYGAYVGGELPNEVADALRAFRTLLGENDALAYLVNMAPRLTELRRVMKSNGSLYLHCDPTMSHYLKVLLDAIFGAERFVNEVAWKRTGAHSSARKFGPVHDVILYYSKGDRPTWNTPRSEYTEEYLDKYYRFDDGDGRLYWRNSLTAAGTRNGSSGQPWRGIDISATGQHWKFKTETLDELDAANRIYWPPKGGFPQIKRFRDALPGLAVGDVWTDIDKINPVAAERLGYPTQKPVALLERIIGASSNEGDVVLDPFCGCGTTIDASIRLGRRWLGVDVTYIAVDLIEKRLLHTYGDDIKRTYDVLGIPRDRGAALALFSRSPFDFERWAVSLVGGQPNQKQVGDKGIDGVARFPLDARGTVGRVLISVKGGKQLNPAMVRDLGGTVTTQKAEMGVLITNTPPTRGMIDEANHAGTYQHPHYSDGFPRIQLITVDELLSGKRPQMPATILPYIQALRAKTPADQGSLFDQDDSN